MWPRYLTYILNFGTHQYLWKDLTLVHRLIILNTIPKIQN